MRSLRPVGVPHNIFNILYTIRIRVGPGRARNFASSQGSEPNQTVVEGPDWSRLLTEDSKAFQALG